MATALSRCKVCLRMHSPHCVAVSAAELVVTSSQGRPVSTELVVTRHGKYRDPEARKAYQRQHMRMLRAAKKSAA